MRRLSRKKALIYSEVTPVLPAQCLAPCQILFRALRRGARMYDLCRVDMCLCSSTSGFYTMCLKDETRSSNVSSASDL